MGADIERRIVIGLITSTDFIKTIRKMYSVKYFQSGMAKRLAAWCIEYFDKYARAPGKNIEGIYFEKAKNGLPKDIAAEIAEDILPGLSDEFISSEMDIPFLIDQTLSYFSEKSLEMLSDQVKVLISEGKVIEAEQLITSHKPLLRDNAAVTDLSDPGALDKVREAFAEAKEPLVTYPRQLGLFWNNQLVRGAFVALMGSEKRGKSYWLMDIVVRAVRQKRNVAFFQAGDMTEYQQIRRFCIHLAKKSDTAKYCGEMLEPVRDCVHNQRDTCTREERENAFGVFPDKSELEIRKDLNFDQLKEAFEENPDYSPCCNCKEYQTKPWGAAWLKKVDVGDPLTKEEASEVYENFFIKNKQRVLLSTHPNNTLSIRHIRSLLAEWKKLYDFKPDVIVVDYADLLVAENKSEFRHQQNEIWKGLRSLSQEEDALVITVTQADANSYEKGTLTLKNFSEDKRKYAHVTAMYGLNQDPKGQEKKKGIMRINELVIREGYFDSANVVYVLQNISRGQPCLASFF